MLGSAGQFFRWKFEFFECYFPKNAKGQNKNVKRLHYFFIESPPLENFCQANFPKPMIFS